MHRVHPTPRRVRIETGHRLPDGIACGRKRPPRWPLADQTGPHRNGCVERVQGTILEECWKPAFARHLIPKQTGLRRDLERYLRYYNTDRAHTGRWTRSRTPESVIGKAKLWS